MSLFGDDDIDTTAMDEAEAKEAAVAGPSIPAARTNPDLMAHDTIEKQVLQWWEAGAMPHTLVLAGPPGIGKATLAFRLARLPVQR